MKLGLRPDDKVVVLLRNCPEVLVSYPAIWRAGCVVIPVLFLLDAKEISYILKNSEAKAIITSPDLMDKVSQALAGATSVSHVVVTGPADGEIGGRRPSGGPADEPSARPGDGPRTVSFDRLVADNNPEEGHVERADADLAVILYTSGTTGNPKGVMQTHRNLYAAVMNSYNSQPRRDLKITSLLVLAAGAQLRTRRSHRGQPVRRQGDPDALVRSGGEPSRLIQEHRVQAMAGVPTMFVYMMNHPRASEFDTSSMERWLVGGAPMPARTDQAVREEVRRTMYVGYGLTESCPGISGDREELPEQAR